VPEARNRHRTMPTRSDPDVGHQAAGPPQSVAEPRADRNRLLRALPDEEFDLLLPHMERLEVPLLAVLNAPNTPFDHVFFPETGVISIVNELAGGDVVEAGTIGNEGMAGISVVLEGEMVPSTVTMQIPGELVRVPAPVVADLLQERPALRRLLHRYAHAFLIQVAQTAACNRAHDITQRCARWMLMTHDRMLGAEHFLLTQEVLSQMLGVRRAGVTVAAGALQEAGLIRYRRGKVTVLDRDGLERASCECYGIVRAHFDRLLGERQ